MTATKTMNTRAKTMLKHFFFFVLNSTIFGVVLTIMMAIFIITVIRNTYGTEHNNMQTIVRTAFDKPQTDLEKLI